MEISLFDAALKGFLNLLQLKVFLAMMVGVSIGTFTAVAPQGLGMPLVYAIALPIVIKWEPVTGMALLIGASSVSAICAAYLPILFGIPGGSGSQATVLDGYPMGKRGEARRALGASFMAGGYGMPDRHLDSGSGDSGGSAVDLFDGLARTFRGHALGAQHGGGSGWAAPDQRTHCRSLGSAACNCWPAGAKR